MLCKIHKTYAWNISTNWLELISFPSKPHISKRKTKKEIKISSLCSKRSFNCTQFNLIFQLLFKTGKTVGPTQQFTYTSNSLIGLFFSSCWWRAILMTCFFLKEVRIFNEIYLRCSPLRYYGRKRKEDLLSIKHITRDFDIHKSTNFSCFFYEYLGKKQKEQNS